MSWVSDARAAPAHIVGGVTDNYIGYTIGV